jgi:RNA polymerase sigma factor (sigma-70 family)
MNGTTWAAAADPEDLERRRAAAAAAGDEAAFAALFEEHRREVYRVARAVTADAEAAKDVLQETFLKVHGNLSRWRRDCRLRTWIVRIAVRTAIDQRRRAARHPPVPEHAPEPRHDPRVRLDDAVALRQVQALSERLDGQQGLILRLRLLGGLTNAEIAGALGLREPNVRMQLSKAIRKLRELL